MRRRVVLAYVFTFPDANLGGQEGALPYCSTTCGDNALADPPSTWYRYRVFVPLGLLAVITCHGCGLTLAEVHQDGSRAHA